MLLAGPIGLHLLFSRQISLGGGLMLGVLWAAVGLTATIGVDSLFWGRWLWPEGEVFAFNTWQNRYSF